MHDTIAAIATTLGVGAISIIRVSGIDAINIVNTIFSSDITNKKTHTVNYGYIKYNNEIIDEVLLTIMYAPKSFTMENTVEINCHGGIATTKKIMELLLLKGCRLALPGEFTKRAFLNGRIDLTKAQAVMELVNVKSESARKIAISNLQGNTTNKIKELREKIKNIITNIEVNIDYPEYLDIEEMTLEKIKTELIEIKDSIKKIVQNSKNSKIIQNGIKVAIIGKPNVGKSSILNQLLQEDKAIVTSVAGTTRDIVEGSVQIDDILLNFIDTAGIRNTNNLVEKIGVDKSLKLIDAADLILLILSNNEELTKIDRKLLDETKDKKRIIVINKNDLNTKINIKQLTAKNIIYTNTLDYNGIASIIKKIKEMFNMEELDSKDFNYVSNINQLNMLEEAKKSLEDIEEGLKNNLPIDMIEIDIKNIWNILGEILGETYSDELLDNLFKDFCVGK